MLTDDELRAVERKMSHCGVCAEEAADALLAEVKRLQNTESELISCDFALPVDGMIVRTSANGETALAYIEHGDWWLAHTTSGKRELLWPRPDHWQQLPEPPHA